MPTTGTTLYSGTFENDMIHGIGRVIEEHINIILKAYGQKMAGDMKEKPTEVLSKEKLLDMI